MLLNRKKVKFKNGALKYDANDAMECVNCNRVVCSVVVEIRSTIYMSDLARKPKLSFRMVPMPH
jgi:hypothetical protein